MHGRVIILFAAFLQLAVPAAVAQQPVDHVELVAKTPCLFEYRYWAFSFRRGEGFVPAA